MVEMNAKALEAVSGGWGFTKIVTISQKNYLDLDMKHIVVTKGSDFSLSIIQNIG
jgi:hypothetical protein